MKVGGREGRVNGGREGGREGGEKGRRKRGRKGGREEGREGRREGGRESDRGSRTERARIKTQDRAPIAAFLTVYFPPSHIPARDRYPGGGGRCAALAKLSRCRIPELGVRVLRCPLPLPLSPCPPAPPSPSCSCQYAHESLSTTAHRPPSTSRPRAFRTRPCVRGDGTMDARQERASPCGLRETRTGWGGVGWGGVGWGGGGDQAVRRVGPDQLRAASPLKSPSMSLVTSLVCSRSGLK